MNAGWVSAAAHPGLVSQEVVPHDGGPAARQLAHVGNHHQWQGTRLGKASQKPGEQPQQTLQRHENFPETDLQVYGEALHREAGLEAEGVKFFCHRKQTLRKKSQSPSDSDLLQKVPATVTDSI